MFPINSNVNRPTETGFRYKNMGGLSAGAKKNPKKQLTTKQVLGASSVRVSCRLRCVEGTKMHAISQLPTPLPFSGNHQFWHVGSHG